MCYNIYWQSGLGRRLGLNGLPERNVMTEEIDWEAVEISQHAHQRFLERWTPFQKPPKDPVYVIRRLLSAVEEVFLRQEFRVVALINHGPEGVVRYFWVQGWLFVVDQDLTTVITAQRCQRRDRRLQPRE